MCNTSETYKGESKNGCVKIIYFLFYTQNFKIYLWSLLIDIDRFLQTPILTLKSSLTINLGFFFQVDVTELCPSATVLAQQLTHVELERLSYIGPEEFVQAFAKVSFIRFGSFPWLENDWLGLQSLFDQMFDQIPDIVFHLWSIFILSIWRLCPTERLFFFYHFLSLQRMHRFIIKIKF